MTTGAPPYESPISLPVGGHVDQCIIVLLSD